jgi:hypothetical protein
MQIVKMIKPVVFLVFCFLFGFEIFAQNIEIKVSGIPISVNGQDSVPVGLFGVHSTTLTPQLVSDWGIEMVRGIEAGPSGSPSFPGKNSVFQAGIKMTIDCYYDRYQPALYLTNRNGWKTQLENLATTYATNSLTMSHKPIMEFWNEPFLNWASKPGANYDNRWYDTSDAVQGGPVRRPGFSEPEKFLTWNRTKWFVQLSPAVNDPVNFYVQLGNNWTALNNLSVGQELQIGSRRFKAVQTWLAKDTHQLSYYSSLANAEIYVKMFKAYATKIKSINPNLRVLAGWGMSFSNDNWQPWRTIYKTTVDSCHQLMDGIHEHHYGGDTRFMTGAYEVINAYTNQKYRKKMPIFNTETGGFTDPQIPGGTSPGRPSDPLLRDRGAFQFTFRELVFNLSRSPDKLQSRAAHEAHFNQGDGMAFSLLRDFRGKLISSTSSSDNAWVATALNGNQLLVAIYNDQNTAQNLDLKINAPAGYTFTGGQKRWVEDSSAGNTIVGRYQDFVANGTVWEQTINLALKSGTVLRFDLTGNLQASVMEVSQHFADTILAKVPSSGNLVSQIKVPGNQLVGVQYARLKLYIRNLTAGSISFNGSSYQIPTNAFFAYIPVEVSAISENNSLVFNSNGTVYDVNMASLELIKGDIDSAIVTSSQQDKKVESRLFSIFPNPTKDKISVFFDSEAASESLPFQCIDVFGRELKSGNLFSGTELNISDWSNGIYLLKIGNKVFRISKG